MKVQEIMNPHPATIGPDISVRDAGDLPRGPERRGGGRRAPDAGRGLRTG